MSENCRKCVARLVAAKLQALTKLARRCAGPLARFETDGRPRIAARSDRLVRRHYGPKQRLGILYVVDIEVLFLLDDTQSSHF